MTQTDPPASMSNLCCIFCCPPWPSKIVAKLAFLPPAATYQFEKYDVTSLTDQETTKQKKKEKKESSKLKKLTKNYKLRQSDVEGLIPLEIDDNQIQPLFVKTKRGNKIACTYIKYTANAITYQRKPPRYVFLFSHGNAVDISRSLIFLLFLYNLDKNLFFSNFSVHVGISLL